MGGHYHEDVIASNLKDTIPTEQVVEEAKRVVDELPIGSRARAYAEAELARAKDYQIPTEIPADKLPAYHFFSARYNETRRPQVMTPLQERYHRDMTKIPRFFPDGTTRLPPQSQSFYVPLTAEGRFDWRQNYRMNGKRGAVEVGGLWDKPKGRFKNEQRGLWDMFKRVTRQGSKWMVPGFGIALVVLVGTAAPKDVYVYRNAYPRNMKFVNQQGLRDHGHFHDV
jgi:hypothetical protein